MGLGKALALGFFEESPTSPTKPPQVILLQSGRRAAAPGSRHVGLRCWPALPSPPAFGGFS